MSIEEAVNSMEEIKQVSGGEERIWVGLCKISGLCKQGRGNKASHLKLEISKDHNRIECGKWQKEAGKVAWGQDPGNPVHVSQESVLKKAHMCLNISKCLCCSRFISTGFPNFRNAFKNNESKMLRKSKNHQTKAWGLINAFSQFSISILQNSVSGTLITWLHYKISIACKCK